MIGSCLPSSGRSSDLGLGTESRLIRNNCSNLACGKQTIPTAAKYLDMDFYSFFAQESICTAASDLPAN